MATAGLLTLLFTDVVGSTELHARLGDHAADDRIQRHLDGVVATVVEHDGTVVKSLGDGVLATFRSARRALACGAALQRRERTEPDALGLRVGLAAGDVIERDGDVHGLAVATASRIAGLAGAGEVLAADLVRQLAGADPGLVFVDRGRQPLRGVPEPVHVVVLDWDGLAGAAAEAGEVGAVAGGAAAAPSTVIVGRTTELARLEAAVDGCLAGRSEVVLLGGDPGMGKTTLATAAAARAERMGAMAAWGACWDGDGAPPFWPWVQALRATVELVESAGIAANLGARRADLARLVPELGSPEEAAMAPSSTDSGDDARFRLFDGVATYLGALSRTRPIVVVLDDLHWADPSSIELLRFVGRAPNRGGLLVVGTYRVGEVGEEHALWPVLGDVARSDGRLELTGLDPAATGELLAALGVPLERAATVHERSGGNPFFVRELSRLPADGDLPAGVRSVLGPRLARLSPHATQVTRLLAVAGELDVDVLEAAAGQPRAELAARVEEATALGVLAPPGVFDRVRFGHALYREAVLAGLAATERRVLHGLVAAALEAARPDRPPAAELAHHHREAARFGGDPAPAARWCEVAGREALAALAFGEAADLLSTALNHLDAGDRRGRAELLLALGDAHRLGGELDRAKATFLAAADIARSLGDGVLLGRAALASCHRGGPVSLFVSFGDPGSLALLEEALTGLPPGDSALRAHLLAALAIELAFPTPEDDGPLLEAIAECRAIADRIGDDGPRLDAALVLLTRGAREAFEEVQRLAPGSPDRSIDVVVKVNEAWLALDAGDVAAADIALRAAEALAARLGIPSFRLMTDLFRGVRAHMEGDLEEARRRADDVISAVRSSSNRFGLSQWGAQAYALRRDLLEAPEPDRVRRFADTFPMPTSWSALAWSLADHGRLPEARAQLLATGCGDRRQPPDDSNRRVWWFQCAHVAAAVADVEVAAWLYDVGVEYEGTAIRAGSGAMYGAADLALGLVAAISGRHEEAERHLRAAVAFNDALPSRPWAARSRVALARLLASTGRAQEASELVTAAFDAATAMGMRGVVAEAGALLAETGSSAAPSEPAPVAPGSGTFRREGDVWLVAFGGVAARVLDTKGMADLALLLARPGVEVHVAELVGVGDELGGLQSKQATLDDTAIAAYRRRLQELAEEEDDADLVGDAARSARARLEREAITDQLSTDLGLGGKVRSTPDWVEKARKTVRRRVDVALKRIEVEHPAAGRHLRRSVRTGAFCAYDPPEPVTWVT